MNVKAKTMPNGIGLGGQLDFFGLWIDAEYGKGMLKYHKQWTDSNIKCFEIILKEKYF